MSKPFELKRVAIVTFIVLLALLFALEFGPGRRRNPAQEVSDEVVALVGNKKITMDEVLNSIDRNANEHLFKNPALAKVYYPNILEELVNMTFLEQQASREGIAVSNSELLAHLQKEEAFSKEGQFDPSTYQKVVQNGTGLTTVAYEIKQRASIARHKLQQFLFHLSYISDEEVHAEYWLSANQANVRFVRFSPAQLAMQASTPTTKEFNKFIEENLKTIEETYQQNSHAYVEPERLRLRQIFIERPANTLEENNVAKTKADALHASLLQGADFETLARESSDDLETKAQGGDMGWKERESLGLPPLLTNIVLEMKTGETSPPLESSRGYFIYRIEERSESHTKPLEVVQPEIALALWTQQKSEQKARTEAEKALAGLMAGKSLDVLFPPKPIELGNLSTSLSSKPGDDNSAAVTTGLFSASHASIPKLGSAESLKNLIFKTTTPGPIPEIQTLGQDFLVLEVIERQHPTEDGFQQGKDALRQTLLGDRAYRAQAEFVQQLKTQAQLQVFPEKLERLYRSDS